ncbi:MAG: restriction endonuclease [Chloroflexi bacterium]|nr:restriction endonuclease [Chloroflexota bacterium]
MVGEGDVRNFAGALDGHNANKGVFVTTSTFSRSALDYAERSPKRLILIDGKALTRLLIEYNVGVVQDGAPLYIKKLDENYFSE